MARRWIFGTAVCSLLLALAAPGCGGSDGASSFGDPNGNNGNGNGNGNGGNGDGFGDDGGTSSNGEGDGSSLPTDQCATASADTAALPVYMLFIVDGSGSMDGKLAGGGYSPNSREKDPMKPSRNTGKKWIALRGALDAFFDDLAAKKDPHFAVGMYLFSSTSAKAEDKVDVPIAYVDATQAAKLRARIDPDVYPSDGTPLTSSVKGQLPILMSYTPTAPVAPGGKLVLVVVTDGVPSSNPQGAIDAITAAQKGKPAVATFAVGVGDIEASSADYDELYMAKLAIAGGTAAPGCNPNWSDKNQTGKPCHFQITPGTKSAADIQKDFLTAIDTIRDTVASCEFPLVKPDGAGDIDPTKVNVVFSVDGKDTTIPQGNADGWTYDDPTDPTKVVLNGAACAEVKSKPNGKVRIVVGCKTVVAPPK